jgi:hypothetical protein
MKLAILLIVIPVLVLLCIAAWVDRDRIGLEHTMYLFSRLID